MARQMVNARNSIVLVPRTRPFSLAYRRLIAWSLEVGLVVMGAAVPWSLGHAVMLSARESGPVVEASIEDSAGQRVADRSANWVALNPVVSPVQEGWARMAQIPPHQLHRQVPRWTNVLWTVAVILPGGVAVGQLLQLSRSGRTWPKQWLGLQVFSMVGGTVLWRRMAVRELVRWGVPLGMVGGLTLVTGASFGVWTPAVIGFLALLEGVSAIAPDNRAWHDRLARTRVALSDTAESDVPLIKNDLFNNGSLSRGAGLDGPLVAATQASNRFQLYGESSYEDDWWLTEAEGNLTSLVVAPRADIVRTQAPSALVLYKSVARSRWWLLSAGLLLACALGFSLGRTTRLSASTQASEDVFLTTAQQLMDDARGDSGAAILMLAQVDDPRTVHYLTDLLSQTSQPETLNSLQQALVSRGLESLPPLLSLSRSLESDLQQPLDSDTQKIRLAQRHMVQGAITKLLAVHSNELTGIKLDRVNLSLYHDDQRTFRLIQPGLLAAGTSWQGANLNRANLAGASFFDPGPDGTFDSYDDVISELRGVTMIAASLEDANLRGAQLENANLRQADLTDANLAYGNLERSQLTNARLMHVNATKSRWQGSNLVGADLTQAIFDDADVSQARLNRIDATHSRWLRAHLAQSDWVGANLTGADFTHADLVNANFQGARLGGVNFSQADLRQANLRDTDLRHATLTGVTLTDADLAGAIFDDGRSLSGSFITPNAQLEGAKRLHGVNFSRVRNLDNRQLNYICAHGGVHPACSRGLSK